MVEGVGFGGWLRDVSYLSLGLAGMDRRVIQWNLGLYRVMSG